MPPRPGQPRVAFASLGCPKNLVDSEVLLGALARDGFAVCGDFRDADVVVTGCLPQRYGDPLAQRLPDVDAFLGIAEADRIAGACRRILARPRGRGTAPDTPGFRPPTAPCAADVSRLRLTPRHYAYVRIAEGCDHTCAFCVIPQIRGPYRSKPVDAVRAEVEELARDGAREIVLIAQDTTAYGVDRDRHRTLGGLLETIANVRGVAWIRILYAHPLGVTPGLIEAMAAIPQVLPYLDMPVQHVTDRMLGLMRRGHGKRRLLEVIEALRARIPRLALRTTVLLGHPGETEGDVDELVETLEAVRFDRLGAFTYSNEGGSRAAGLPDPVPAAEAERRRDRVMRVQQRIAFARNRSRVGETVQAIVDAGPVRGRPATGRTEGDAPDIDGTIRLRGKGLEPGRILRARVTGADGYDLEGRVTG